MDSRLPCVITKGQLLILFAISLAQSQAICASFYFWRWSNRGGHNSSKLWQTLSRLDSLTLYVLLVHIAEDDILRWGQIVEAVGALSQGLAWLGVLVVRIHVNVCITALLQRLIQFLMSKLQSWLIAVTIKNLPKVVDPAPAPCDSQIPSSTFNTFPFSGFCAVTGSCTARSGLHGRDKH